MVARLEHLDVARGCDQMKINSSGSVQFRMEGIKRQKGSKAEPAIKVTHKKNTHCYVDCVRYCKVVVTELLSWQLL